MVLDTKMELVCQNKLLKKYQERFTKVRCSTGILHTKVRRVLGVEIPFQKIIRIKSPSIRFQNESENNFYLQYSIPSFQFF